MFFLYKKSAFSYKRTLPDDIENDMIHFLCLVFSWARVEIVQKFRYEVEILILRALTIANKMLEWQSAI